MNLARERIRRSWKVLGNGGAGPGLGEGGSLPGLGYGEAGRRSGDGGTSQDSQTARLESTRRRRLSWNRFGDGGAGSGPETGACQGPETAELERDQRRRSWPKLTDGGSGSSSDTT